MKRAFFLMLAVALTACEARFDQPLKAASGTPGPDPVVAAPPVAPGVDGWPSFAPAEAFQLRRLTSEQYVATVQRLLGVSAAGMPAIEPVSAVAGFAQLGAASSVLSSNGVAQFEDAANFFAAGAFADPVLRARAVPCVPAGATDVACFQNFVSAFGPRAFRRPLTADEQTRYATLAADVASAANDPWAGLEATTSAFLQSPNFLYLTEVGEPDPALPARFRYTPYELAARLSYFLTDLAPDDALLSAAASGSLSTPEGLRAQAERLLATPAARAAVRGFFTSLLALNGLDTLSRPVALFPKFTPTLGAALKEQTLRTLEDVVFDQDGDFRQAFVEPTTFLNPELAGFYGVAAPAGSGFSKVSVPSRTGLLGQAGVLAVHDHPDATSPTKRGLFVLTRLLCQPLALSPPANVNTTPPTGVITARQRLEEHSTNPTCASCHVAMDSVGLSLEHFDALGAYRETDRTLAIDDKGTLTGKAYQGEQGLGAALKDHPALGPCLAQSIYGAGVGHMVTEFDRGGYASAVSGFDASGARVQALLLSVIGSDSFRYFPAPN